MPKATDSTCPLGFHPQFRRPNYCKRCFREYSEHKTGKEGSSTSINSLSFDRKDGQYGSRDSLLSSNRLKDEVEGLTRSRSDLSSNSLTRSTSVEEDRDKGSWTKARPMSWSAQDLRKAVDDAKEAVKASRQEVDRRYYGSTRSLTQDLGSLSRLTESATDLANEIESKKSFEAPPSFSSYLASKAKSLVRGSLERASSLQGVTSATSTSKIEEESDIYSSKRFAGKPEVNNINESKTSVSSSIAALDGRPPKAPSRLKLEKPTRLPDLQEMPEMTRSEKSKKIIQSLRREQYNEDEEVKSEDADASYVIQIRPKKKTEETVSKKVEIDLQPEVERLQKEVKELNKLMKELTEKNDQLESEKTELLTKKPRFGDLKRQTDTAKLQSKVDELNDDIKKKNKEVKDLKKELDKRPLPKDIEKTMEDLRSKLQAAEQLCEELMDENEDYKKEIRTLEDEIEEMQDNFREEQADEYRDLKRELEQRAKDCRVLQFKLKKAERRSEHMERDKVEFEEKLHELQVGEGDIERAERVQQMEKELNLAKEVSMKMHEEMEKMKSQLEDAEKDKKKLKERVLDSPVKPGSKVSRAQMMGKQGSQDNTDQALRDLQDALEREQDLKDQLKFAEEETRNLRKKLSRVEEENETLQLQLNKMSSKAKQSRQKSMERSGSTERSGSVERGSLSRQGSTEKPPPVLNGEEIDPTDLKIQLELNEQESTVLRRKVEDLESENLRLQKELKELLSSSDFKKPDLGTIPETFKDNVYFSKKIKMMEEECSDLRKKIIESEKDRDQLKSELETAKKRAKVTRSRSLEQAEAEEKKRQELIEQETGALKSKVVELEEINEKLLDENKTLNLKAQRRLPLSTHENMYIEKQVLEEKVKRMEKKLKEAQAKAQTPSLTNSHESVASNKDLKISELQSLVDNLQSQCNSLSNENEEMKQTSGYKDRTPRVPKDITPKATLIKWVNELEKECANLNASLKLKETETQVLENITNTKCEGRKSIDGEMCLLLFNECDSLRSEISSFKTKIKEKEAENKYLMEKLSDAEHELRNTTAALTKFKESESLQNKVNADEWQDVRVSSLTSKAALKKTVEELNELCAMLHAALKEAESKRTSTKAAAEKTTSVRDLEDKLTKERERNQELIKQLKEEKEKLSTQMNKIVPNKKEENIRNYEEKIELLQKELKHEKEKYDESRLKKQQHGTSVGFEELRAAQTEKHKLQKELSSCQETISVLERKLRESEDTLKCSEKTERNLKSLLEQAEAKLEEERSSQSSFEGRQKDMTISWLKEREELKREVMSAKKVRDSLEKEIRQSERQIKGLESQLQTERKRTDEVEGRAKTDKEDLKKLRKEYENLELELDEVKDTVNRLEKEKKKQIKLDKEGEQLMKEREDLQIRMNTLESELKIERKKRERLELDSSVGLQGKTAEIEDFKKKLQNIETENQKLKTDMEYSRKEYESRIKALEKKLSKEKENYDYIQAKYDYLEETMGTQAVPATQGESNSALKREYETLQHELKALRETYNNHKDKWIKEKLDIQFQMKELEERSNKQGDNGLFAEKLRLRNIIDGKNQQLDAMKVESDTIKDQLSYYRRESEDLRRKVDDLEKLQELAEKRQSSTVDTTGYESTIKDLRSRLTAIEKNNKTEVTKMKMRYDTKIKAINEELTTVTQHMSKYRRERDTYKEMLDGAQKTIAELKGVTGAYRPSKADSASEMAAAAKRQADHQAKAHLTEVQDLQSLITEAEDKLTDSRLEITKLKNESVDQKTNYEIQLCDLQTKLNEYEEDRLLVSGGRRVPGLRTRLELNWQKEREEQQRLIHETTTLAKDLRQTLYEVERERDMERLEAKRKIEQLKRTVCQDHHDTKSKVQELQRDLLELREAHAKLRQINEKLRREKDRTEVEREAMRDKFLGSSREHLNQQAKMERLLEELTKVKDLSPLVLGESIDGKEQMFSKMPADPKPKTREEFTEALRKLNKTSEELRVMMNLADDRDLLKRTPSFRRALSVESDDEGSSPRSHSAGRRGLHRPIPRGQKSQLYRKSQSLDHQLADDKGKIWVSSDAGSTSSIESAATDEPRREKYDLDRSLDRISTGSQTSDLDLTSEQQQKKKGIKGVFSKFGKSKSIEDTSTGGSIVGAGLQAIAPGLTGSGSSIASETEKETSVKGKLKTLFKIGPTTTPAKKPSSEKEGPNIRSLSSKFEVDNQSTASKPALRPSRATKR